MATIVHRRPMRPATPVARGPGASLAALTPVGWTSLVLAVGWIVVAAFPGLTITEARQLSWGSVLQSVWMVLPDAATLGLPAALEVGTPGARRRVPWLMRGAVLLAAGTLASAAVSLLNRVAWDLMSGDPSFGGLGERFPGGAFSIFTWLLGVGVSLLRLAGAWALSDGLADAGGRPGRRVLVAMAALGLVLESIWLPVWAMASWPELELDVGQALTSAVGSLLGLAGSVLWLVIAARLVAGWRAGVRPRLGWRLGAIAGFAIVGSRLTTLAGLFGPLGDGPWFLYSLAWALPDALLVVAFLGGLGRGRERRDDRARLRRRAVIWVAAAVWVAAAG